MKNTDLKKVVSKIGTKNSLEVLNTVKLDNNKITVSNLETTVILETNINGSGLIDSNDFCQVLTLLKDFDTEQKENSIDFFTKKETITLQNSINISEFPKETIEPVKDFGKLENSDIAKIKVAVKFTGNDDLRPVMKHVFIDNNGICATDAHRMYFNSSNGLFLSENSLLIPKDVIYILDTLNITNISIFESDKYIRFCFIGGEIIFYKWDGKFPNYKAVIPESHNTIISIDKKQLKETVKKALMFTNKTTNAIKIDYNINNGVNKTKISSNDVDFGKQYDCILDSVSTGIDVTFGLNGKFLMEFINSIDSDVIDFKILEPTRGVILNNNFLLMPIKL